MGLAASQAKLLSLTCRISDNELRSQSITAAKMALANQTTEASREYMKALNTNEFIYRTYDDDGEKVYTQLTGTQLSAYAPLKNQYALINPQGQVLVSELDAANYEASANMTEFLEKYGVNQIETGYDNKDVAQWYINLWHRMNGESDEKTVSENNKQWNILEDGLMNSQDWLKYALESGTVTLERVNFSEPTEDGTGLKKATWTSIIYTNALDISEQTDETAIAKAEAKYQQKTREIENKDKQYDSMLKLLDTEHNALQQEYDTTKEVIKKNTDRTIKIYQA